MQSKKHSDYQRSYGRIKSRKLREGNVKLLDEVLPQVKLEGAKVQRFVGTFREVWLEIGFGGGEHLAHRASQNPEVGIIGCEPFINGAVKLLREIKEKNLKNVLLHNGDAREILENNKFEFARVYILFPDPWPEKKHNKRRIISHSTLDMLAPHIAKGGRILLATDHADYAKWILRILLERKDFEWTAKTGGEWHIEFEGHIKTKYQIENMAKAAKPFFLEFIKIS